MKIDEVNSPSLTVCMHGVINNPHLFTAEEVVGVILFAVLGVPHFEDL